MPTLEKQWEEAMISVTAQPGRICPENVGWMEDPDYVGCRAAHITHMVNHTLGVSAVTHVDRDGVIVDFDDAASPQHRRHAISRAGTGICITRSMPLVAGDTPLPHSTHVLEFDGSGDLTSSALAFDPRVIYTGMSRESVRLSVKPSQRDDRSPLYNRSSISIRGRGYGWTLVLEIMASIQRRTGGERIGTIDMPTDPHHEYVSPYVSPSGIDSVGNTSVDSRFVDHAVLDDLRKGQVTDLSHRVPLRGATIHELFEVFRRQVNDAAGRDIIAELSKAA